MQITVLITGVRVLIMQITALITGVRVLIIQITALITGVRVLIRPRRSEPGASSAAPSRSRLTWHRSWGRRPRWRAFSSPRASTRSASSREAGSAGWSLDGCAQCSLRALQRCIAPLADPPVRFRVMCALTEAPLRWGAHAGSQGSSIAGRDAHERRPVPALPHDAALPRRARRRVAGEGRRSPTAAPTFPGRRARATPAPAAAVSGCGDRHGPAGV